mmetsp:Transcript_11177/g.25021  ORF Transcript_11177/g.25021 Transcript_11177/m.25021 type:complete len:224 (-) Transcript_11177:1075-1746(-)
MQSTASSPSTGTCTNCSTEFVGACVIGPPHPLVSVCAEGRVDGAAKTNIAGCYVRGPAIRRHVTCAGRLSVVALAEALVFSVSMPFGGGLPAQATMHLEVCAPLGRRRQLLGMPSDDVAVATLHPGTAQGSPRGRGRLLRLALCCSPRGLELRSPHVLAVDGTISQWDAEGLVQIRPELRPELPVAQGERPILPKEGTAASLPRCARTARSDSTAARDADASR